MTRIIAVLLCIAPLMLPAMTMADDPVAVVTELRAAGGAVEVKRVGEPAWRAAQPLHALRVGDQIRASGTARAVVVFTGGRGAQSVSATNSPFTVQPPAAGGSGDKLRSLLGGIAGFLSGKQKDLAYVALSVREVRPPRVLQLAPRDTRILPGTVSFEWNGSDSLRYGIRVLSVQGVLWEQADLPRRPVAYPASAPALRPGVRYLWQLEAAGQPVQQTEFEMLAPGDVARVQDSLGILVPASLPEYPPSSVAIMRAGYLLRDGLYADARRELLAALAKEPDEPTLHLLLGQVYETIGLTELAEREYVDARDFSASR
jgi:hypothetical protein